MRARALVVAVGRLPPGGVGSWRDSSPLCRMIGDVNLAMGRPPRKNREVRSSVGGQLRAFGGECLWGGGGNSTLVDRGREAWWVVAAIVWRALSVDDRCARALCPRCRTRAREQRGKARRRLHAGCRVGAAGVAGARAVDGADAFAAGRAASGGAWAWQSAGAGRVRPSAAAPDRTWIRAGGEAFDTEEHVRAAPAGGVGLRNPVGPAAGGADEANPGAGWEDRDERAAHAARSITARSCRPMCSV